MARAIEHSPDRPIPSDADPKAEIVLLLKRYGTESTRLGQVFAERERLQHADIRALVAIIEAERRGAPLTPGRLSRDLRLSSAGTSYVIDRLEAAGHVRRSRDEARDNRVVHLRHTDHGMKAAQSFFTPLGKATEALLTGFTDAEVGAIARFLTQAVDALVAHVEAAASNP